MVAPDPAPDPVAVPPGPPSVAPDPPAGRGRLAGMALAAGLIAGLLAWLVGEGILEAYRADLNPRMRRGGDPQAGNRFDRARFSSATGTYAAMGAFLGLGLGLAGGLARGSGPAGARAAALGGVVGAIAGASSSMLAVPRFFANYDPQSQDLVLPMLALGSIGSAVGAAGGLAFGIGLGGRGRWPESLMGGLVGAALATAVYEVVGGIAFPIAKTELPISQDPETRAMLHVLVATLAAAGAALATGLSSRGRVAAPTTPPTAP